jgi:hypothetical protein
MLKILQRVSNIFKIKNKMSLALTVTQVTTNGIGVSTQLLAANTSRKFLEIQNNGAATVYLTFDGSAATTNSYPIVQNTIERFDINSCPIAQINYNDNGVSTDLRIITGV